MKPPAFWFNPPQRPGWQARALAAPAALYARATAARVARQADAARRRVPVICVGNINAGGTGKTPTVIALIEMLNAMDQDVRVVSRGYGGRAEGPLRVDPQRHEAGDVGDEPLLISAFAPVWIGRDRSAAMQLAEADGASVLILDDGFQNPHVRADLSLVVVDADIGFGNGRVIPAGPLREPVGAGLARADRVVAIGEDDAQTRFGAAWGDAIACPVSPARLAPLATGMPLDKMRLFAFAGIGRPGKFFATLRATGAEIAATRALDDHQRLGSALMTRIAREAEALGAQLVTTEKDAVRLPPDWRRQVLTLPVRLTFDDPDPVRAALSALF